MYDTILVPTDGSDGAQRAVEFATDLAAQYEARLHVLFVVDQRQYGEPALSSIELLIDELEDYGHELLDEISETAIEREIPVEHHHCHGIPSEEILDCAEEVNADVIVMGYRGRTHEDMIGSTADQVLRTSDRPTLLV